MTVVAAVSVPVKLNAPDIVKAPPRDTALPPIEPTVVAKVFVVVTSPERFPFVIEVEPENAASSPLVGLPVVVTVPVPALMVLQPKPVPLV